MTEIEIRNDSFPVTITKGEYEDLKSENKFLKGELKRLADEIKDLIDIAVIGRLDHEKSNT